ncbi:YybH family protein [Pseudomonas sp. EA_35y_Pfl2_R5]|uniref:YybH family protein n=1 Tax=Pseudomonas sp. EA_35y_Pfl2_R5 TaxID=3088690 RepID=UPI0030DD1AB2
MSNSQAQIQQQLDSWAAACRSKDVSQIISHYAEDVVAYDAIGPLRFQGRAAYQAHWQACMEMCSGQALFEIHQPSFLLSDGLAVVHYLFHCGGSDDKGEMQSSWMRVSQCFRLQGGQWLIAHEHFSMPCDMESGKVLFDLQP